MPSLQAEIAKNRSVQFRSLFQRIARASIAASALGLVACGSSQSPVNETVPTVTTDPTASVPRPGGMTCVEERWSPTEGWDPVGAYDYAGVFEGPCAGCQPEPVEIDSTGTACETASDQAACEAEVSTMVHQTHLLTTTTTGAERFVDAAQLNAFLGPINTADEALLVILREGYEIRCGAEDISVAETDDGYEVWATRMTADCDPIEVTSFHFRVGRDGSTEILDQRVISSEMGMCVGRRPEGLLASSSTPNPLPLAHFFGEVARLEESAVTAFERLAEELRLLGAPETLVEACLDAARDEERHTVQMGALATRFGATLTSPMIDAPAPRTMFQIALENAVEGCVRETYGALVGVHQSLTAKDAEVREVMGTVAADETRHSELSWRVAEWLEPQLSDDERQRLKTAQRRAIIELRSEMSAAVPSELVEQAGVPAPETALHMLDQLTSSLFN